MSGPAAADGPALRFITIRDAEHAGELDLRYRVLRVPLGMARGQTPIPGEDEALHLVALDGPRVVGCLLYSAGGAREEDRRLRAMAVDPAWQGRGLGARLLGRMEEELRRRGVDRVTLHARDTAIGFYLRCGYRVYGEPFTEVGIAHACMDKRLSGLS